MEAATAQPDVSLMNMPLRTASIALLILAISACGPADEQQRNLACSDQPGPRSKQSCYEEFERRYAAVVDAQVERDRAAGADSGTIRIRRAEFEARLAKCGVRPDTSGRPSDAELLVWSCRETGYRREMAVHLPRS
jgi:hypothetical protein